MAATAVVLLSGSLDSLLAAHLLIDEGLHVVGFCHDSICQPRALAAQAAAELLGISLLVREQDEGYVRLLRQPKHGYGRGLNPCLDCRIHVFRLAHDHMHAIGAELVASGEVLGQHPMTQKRRDLELIAAASGLGDRLLRPLSAKHLTATLAERTGLIAREHLLDLRGQGRKAQIALAHERGLPLPTTLPACALAEKTIADRVRALLDCESSATAWDFALTRIGHHVRLAGQTLVVLGRDATENAQLTEHFARVVGRHVWLLEPANFPGPTALIVGAGGTSALDDTKRLILARAKFPPPVPRWQFLRNDL